MRNRAMCVALRKTAWLPHETTSKLLRLQNQDYNRPHPTAFSTDKRHTAIGRWITNMTPGAQYPCPNCDGAYSVSRYHISRCSDARSLLGEWYDPLAHAKFLPQTDNVLDPMIMNLVPEDERRDAILRDMDRCPGLARPEPQPPPLPPEFSELAPLFAAPRACDPMDRAQYFCDPDWVNRACGIGSAIKKMSSLCCRRDPQRGRQVQLSIPDASSGDRSQREDRPGPPAFSSLPRRFLIAEDRYASVPVRPPAR